MMELSDYDILHLFKSRRFYHIDYDTYERVEIVSAKTGKPLVRCRMGRTDRSEELVRYTNVRLAVGGKRRNIAVARVVWIVTRNCTIPPGFEIHHDNEDCYDDSPDNLLCIFGLDHQLLHRKLLNGVKEF